MVIARLTAASALVTTKNGRVKLAAEPGEAWESLTEDGSPSSEEASEWHRSGR